MANLYIEYDEVAHACLLGMATTLHRLGVTAPLADELEEHELLNLCKEGRSAGPAQKYLEDLVIELRGLPPDNELAAKRLAAEKVVKRAWEELKQCCVSR